MSDRKSTIVDFTVAGEAGYQQIFVRVASALPNRLPLLSSISAQLDDLLVAYDYFPPGATPNILSKQHGLGIFIDLPAPVTAERWIEGKLRREVVRRGDTVITNPIYTDAPSNPTKTLYYKTSKPKPKH
jgi:AraC family transcriptional regulator